MRRTPRTSTPASAPPATAHNPTYYERFTKWADDYFYIPHRGVPRGVGGIFYDHLECADEAEWERNFAFTRASARRSSTCSRSSCAGAWAGVDAGGQAAPARMARPLRRIQPGLRPGHAVRPQDRRQHRRDPDEPAARGEVELSVKQCARACWRKHSPPSSIPARVLSRGRRRGRRLRNGRRVWSVRPLTIHVQDPARGNLMPCASCRPQKRMVRERCGRASRGGAGGDRVPHDRVVDRAMAANGRSRLVTAPRSIRLARRARRSSMASLVLQRGAIRLALGLANHVTAPGRRSACFGA